MTVYLSPHVLDRLLELRTLARVRAQTVEKQASLDDRGQAYGAVREQGNPEDVSHLG